MKRRIMLKLAVFLLLGAIINVAVAWGCAACIRLPPDFFNAEVTLEHQLCATDREWIATSGISGERITIAGERITVFQDKQMALERRVFESTDKTGVTWVSAERRLAGFPMFSFYGEIFPWRSRSGLMNIDNWQGRTESWSDRLIPFNPIWLGFLANTIFYAAILWLLVAAPFKLRRYIRTKRQRCPACGYPVGTSPLCTECGKPVTPRTGNRQ